MKCRRVNIWASLVMVLSLGLASCDEKSPSAPAVTGVRLSASSSACPGSEICVDGVLPTEEERGATIDLRFFGQNFSPGSKAQLGRNGKANNKVTTNSTTYVSDTELSANITIASNAEIALYDAIVSFRGSRGIGTELFAVKENNGNEFTDGWVEATGGILTPDPGIGRSNFDVMGDGRKLFRFRTYPRMNPRADLNLTPAASSASCQSDMADKESPYAFIRDGKLNGILFEKFDRRSPEKSVIYFHSILTDANGDEIARRRVFLLDKDHFSPHAPPPNPAALSDTPLIATETLDAEPMPPNGAAETDVYTLTGGVLWVARDTYGDVPMIWCPHEGTITIKLHRLTAR